MLKKEQKNSLNKQQQELTKFDALAREWWDPNGKFKHVLAFNGARLHVLRAEIMTHFSMAEGDKPLSGLRILDIGCGGGLLSEPLAALGAEVLGIDGSEMSIEVAKAHANQAGVSISYEHCLAEELLARKFEPFDVVLNTEVIEHVDDQQALIDTCCALCKPNGLLLLATLNRTFKSWLFGIVGAEYVLRLLPRGTHDWRYFVTPEDFKHMLALNRFTIRSTHGLSFNPFTKVWRSSGDIGVNYLLSAVSDQQPSQPRS